MSNFDWLAIGAAIMAVVIYLFNRSKSATVIPLDKDAQRRLKYKQEQEAMEAEVTKKIEQFRAKKEQYKRMKEQLNNDDKARTNPNDNSNPTRTPADILVITGPSGGDNDGKNNA